MTFPQGPGKRRVPDAAQIPIGLAQPVLELLPVPVTVPFEVHAKRQGRCVSAWPRTRAFDVQCSMIGRKEAGATGQRFGPWRSLVGSSLSGPSRR